MSEKIMSEELHSLYTHCTLCPRRCGIDRTAGRTGRCGMSADLTAARAALHLWEEPCLTGPNGAGTVFFTGCSLGCIFCQNSEISHDNHGWSLSARDLADIFLNLQDQGAANIDLVTACHYVPHVIAALENAKDRGLTIPILYNSSGYESVGTLRLLDGLIDIYLPDFKYLDPNLAACLSGAADYPDRAKEALAEMVRQIPDPVISENGLMRRGIIVRHLLLPGHVREAKNVVNYLHTTYGDNIFISLLRQYTPTDAVTDDPLLGRRVTRREYDRLVDCAVSIGITNGFIQEGASAKQSYIPSFRGEGLPAHD